MIDFKIMIENAAITWYLYCKRHHLRLTSQNKVMYRARFNLFMALWVIKNHDKYDMENESSNIVSNASYVLNPVTRSKITAHIIEDLFLMQLNHTNIKQINLKIDQIIKTNKIDRICVNTFYDLYSRMNFYFNAVIVDAESKDIEHFLTVNRLIVDDSDLNLEQFASSCFS
jgi:hypothetical protein